MKPLTVNTISDAENRREELLADLRANPSGIDWCDRYTQVADDVLRAVYLDVSSDFVDLPPLAIIATGGYGRRELAPYSDVDLTIIPLDEAHPQLDPAVKALFRAIQQAFDQMLRISVGYSYRLISDAPGLDARTRTSLLDARYVVGSRRGFESLMRAYWESFPVAEFLIDKLNERRGQFARYNDTPYAVEPNLKEGAGGLRCYQTANWLGAAVGERMRRSTESYDHVLMARNLLHYVAGKHQDQLTRVKENEVASLLSLSPLDFGSDLAQALSELHEEYLRAVERLHEARFPLGSGGVALRGEIRIVPGASSSDASLAVAFATQLGLRVAEVQASATHEVSGPEALIAISAGEPVIRNMDRCGVLQVLLPELTACRTLMPTDISHAYTVFEHTLRVVRAIDNIEPNTFVGELKGQLRDLGPLYLAALMHDVGKVEPFENHSTLGEGIALNVCKRWRLTDATSELVSWLVREHLTLDRFIRMRDVLHPETAVEFAKVVKTQDRLAMLALLTWADATSVSTESWSQVQDTFLRELFVRTQAALHSEQEVSTDPVHFRKRIMRTLKNEEAPEEQVHAFVESLPAHYLLSTDPERVREHFQYAKRAEKGEVIVELEDHRSMGATDVTVCCPDAAGLLNRILGVLYALDFSLVGIRASTTKSSKPVALDTFTVTFGGRPVPGSTARQLSSTLYQVLRGEKSVAEVLKSKNKDPERRQQIFTYTYIEGEPGILEIRAPRGRGMPYRISKAISEQGWNILSARVGQWAGNGAAAFYLLGQDMGRIPKDAVERAFSPKKV